MKFLTKLVSSAPELLLNDSSKLLLQSFNQKELQLWNGILSGKMTNNKSVSGKLYGVSPSSATFQKFKIAFRYKLDNIILLYKNANASKFQIAYQSALKEHHIIKILMNLGFRRIAIPRARQLAKNCQKYHFNDIGENITKILWKNSAVFENKMDDYSKYFLLYKQFRKLVDIEVEAERYYAELINYYNQKRALSAEISNRAGQYYKELKQHIKKIDSYKFHIEIYRIAIIEHESNGDQNGCIQICKDAIEYFQGLNFNHNGAIQIFKRKMVNYLLQLNKLSEAESIIQDLILHNPEKNHIWFLNQEQIFLIKMRSQKYDEAQKLLQFVGKQNRFDSESAEVKDKWSLYRVYIDLLGYMGVLASSPKPARIIKRIDSLSRYRGDKMGMNLALLICQTIYVYFAENGDHLGVHIDAIKKYSSTYLKDGNDRSKLFLKMLCLLPLRGFENARFEKQLKQLKEKLEEKSIAHVSQASDIEVIPYEDLWNLVLMKSTKSISIGHQAPKSIY